MFISKRGGAIRGFSSDEFVQILRTSEELGVSPIQMAEAASYSYAMVARSSLGLSSKDAILTVLISDSLAGCIALGTLRHLFNSGANGNVFLVGTTLEHISADLAVFIQPLLNCGVSVQACNNFSDIAALRTSLESSHAALCGLASTTFAQQLQKDITDLLNELSTPIHSVIAPLGINWDTGTGTDPIFSSTTLSIGVPLTGLETSRESVGRHYLCDISIPKRVFDDRGEDFTHTFSEQPITQLFVEGEIKKSEKAPAQ